MLNMRLTYKKLGFFLIFMCSFIVLSAHNNVYAQQPEFCWKDSYGRGVGTIPTQCASGQQKIGALCYDKCPANTKRFGFDCHSVCPSGMRNDGLFCRAAEYGRGAGYPWKFGDKAFSLKDAKRRCERKHGSCEKNGAIYYPKCREGYSSFGCCICRPKTPNCRALGMNPGIDLSCAKKVYIGKPKTAGCGKKEYDAGLCYNKCRDGYNGVGPVCWGKVPSRWVACGMGAAKNSTTCASITFGQVAAAGTLALNVATLGGSGAATAAATGPQKASRLAKLKEQYEKMKAAYEAARKTSTALQNAEKAYKVYDTTSKTYKAVNTAQNVVTEEDMVRLAAQIAAIVDTSGVSATVGAYTYPKCSKYFGASANAPSASTPKKPSPSAGGSGSFVRWVKWGGRNPRDTIIGGSEPGRSLPVCRAPYRGATHPGKVVAGKCNFGYGGKEVVTSTFEVLTGKNLKWTKNRSASGAVVGGVERGAKLVVCRARYNKGVHPGKLLAGKCNIGWGGREIQATDGIEILTR
jgi:hypothetical protein